MKSRRLSKQKRAFPESGRFGERDGQRVVEGEGEILSFYRKISSSQTATKKKLQANCKNKQCLKRQ